MIIAHLEYLLSFLRARIHTLTKEIAYYSILSKTSTCYGIRCKASYGTRKNSAFEKENEENRELSLDRQNSIHKKCKINKPVSSTKNLKNIKGSAKGLLKRFRLNGHTIWVRSSTQMLQVQVPTGSYSWRQWEWKHIQIETG